MTKTHILLAEDHVILREGIRAILTMDPELEVIGEAGDGMQAVVMARELQPDLVLMDLSMPLLNGTEATRQIKQRFPQIRVIVMTVHKTDEHVRASLHAGADAYLLKEESHRELLTAIASVNAGGTHVSPIVCGKLVTGYLGQSTTPDGAAVTWDTLTEREREVVKLVAEGYKNREIGERLCVSVKTVEKHRANVMRKLDLHSAAALTAYAIGNGLVTQQ